MRVGLVSPKIILATAVGMLIEVVNLSTAATPIIFADSFDAEPGSGQGASGQSGINYAGFANWSVSSGTVDLIAHGDFGIDCAGSSGKCVDLDGATSNAGILTSVPIALVPGVYQFSFELAGTDSGFGGAAAAAPNVVDVAIGSLFVTQVTRNQGDPLQVFGGQFSVASPTMVQITFANQGGDNFGAMLDNVQLAVPEPGIFSLLASGVVAFGLRRPIGGLTAPRQPRSRLNWRS